MWRGKCLQDYFSRGGGGGGGGGGTRNPQSVEFSDLPNAELKRKLQFVLMSVLSSLSLWANKLS